MNTSRVEWVLMCACFVALILTGSTQLLAQPESAVMKPRVLTPAEFLTGDTTSSTIRTNIPGAITGSYTPMQDSLYKWALAARVTAQARFAYDVRATSEAIELLTAIERQPSVWENINRNLAIPAQMLQPSDQERAQYDLNIANAMYVPGVLMWPMGTGNLQVSMGDIGRILGLSEDVSPRIRYALGEPEIVTIVVYSSSAVEVATIFTGAQNPGAYEIVWNGLNDKNQMVGKGDYIAEVRIGEERIQRKRISWPPSDP